MSDQPHPQRDDDAGHDDADDADDADDSVGFPGLATDDGDDAVTLHNEPGDDLGDPDATLGDGRDSGGFVPEMRGRYRVLRRLGEGGIGIVHAAVDRTLEREIAVKSLRAGRQRRGQTEARFIEEARLTGQLEHPGIIPVYELGRRRDGSLYYTMPLVRGATLADALDGADLDARLRLLPRLIDVCQAVAYAHSRNVIHRDLKPANVMMGDYGRTLVLDWGLAKVIGGATSDDGDHADGSRPTTTVRATPAELEPEDRRIVERPSGSFGVEQVGVPAIRGGGEGDEPGVSTQTDGRFGGSERGLATVVGSIIGTPAYMPPEQARGQTDRIDKRSDVWALGAMLYELLAGRPPFVGRNAWEVTLGVIEAPIVPPAELERRCPRELSAITMRALTRDRDRRYPDAAAMVADIEAYAAGERVSAHAYGKAELALRWMRRHAVALLVTATLIGVGAGAWLMRGRQAAEDARIRLAVANAEAVAEVERVLEASRSPRVDGWADAAVSRLIARKRPAVERRLLSALADPSRNIRSVAARALGGMASTDAIDALIARLEPEVEREPAVLVDVIRALGAIGDARADDAVDRARRRAGQHTFVWNATQAAYEMIPPPPIAAAGRLDANAWVDRGNVLIAKRMKNEAFAHYDRAIELDPKLARAWTNRGMAYRQLGDINAAIDSHNEALRLDPDNVPARINRAVAFALRREAPAAIADLDHVVDVVFGANRAGADKAGAKDDNRGASGDPRGGAGPGLKRSLLTIALRARAINLDRVGQGERAAADVDAALREDPTSTRTLVVMAMLAWGAGQTERAISHVQGVLERDESNVQALLLRADGLRLRGRLEAARADLDAAIAYAAKTPGALAKRADLLLAMGRRGAAIADLDRAIAQEPESAMALLERAVLLHAREGRDEAARADVRAAMAVAQPIESAAIALVSAGIDVLAGLAPRWQAGVVGQIPVHDAMVAFASGESPNFELSARVERPDDRCLLAIALRLRGADPLRWQGARLPAAALGPQPYGMPQCVLATLLKAPLPGSSEGLGEPTP